MFRREEDWYVDVRTGGDAVLCERFADVPGQEHYEVVAIVELGWCRTIRGALITPEQAKALAEAAGA